ncbi:Protein CBG08299 [Caenorhabditis briggsae]|uniref:Uncharacterized protein n=2 Tax=Caenorhabditis briggsae TaxID=6238 RepID=A0AAE9ABA6_CAEBR|nr:Protein CBG08299 [Caenorhabditis briggsae]ULT97180.1 hypothetical protein L3Y34_005182 [Caenorhabditis briggsae]CAP28150.1 Protein CBG08299 [Caenorhabditis briggsae]
MTDQEVKNSSAPSTRTAVVPSGMSVAKQAQKPTDSLKNIVPFNASLFTILTIIGTLQISALSPSLGSFLSLIISLFTYEWQALHLPSMTRSRRACFDVANVLETYQPRARTHGHLFVPDPPTPCVKISEEGNQHMPKEKNAFSNARDAHYENMYQKAIQMAKEMDQMEKLAASPNLDASQNVELKPADPEKDKKDSEEKAKQAKKKYDEDMAKPFSC